MDINQIYTDIQELNNLIYLINKRDTSAIEELNRLYRIVFGETVTAGCSNCHIKAFRKLTDLTIQDLSIMQEQKFKIKKGVLVEYPFRSGRFFSAALGITNELATEYLKAYPQKVTKFEVYPGSESESGALDLSSVSGKDSQNDLSKMNKTALQAEYLKTFDVAADESLTKAQLKEAIEKAD